MKAATVEKLIWPLVYGGLLAICLGVFVQPRDAGLAAALWVGGGLATAAGVALIVLRSRLKE